MKHVIIITGASSGMGAEFARQIYNSDTYDKTTEPVEMWLISRSHHKILQIAESLAGKKIKVRVFSMDFSGRTGTDIFKATINAESTSDPFTVDLLINNAGVGTYGPFFDTDTEKEMDMIDLNCTSLTGITGFALPFMPRGSTIINVSSLAAFMPLGNFAVYAATKAYVLSYSVALAAELKEKGIKVCALCPGSVSTNFANIASNGARKEVLHGKDPVKVVKHCLKKAKKGKHIILWAPKWKFISFMSRFISRYTVARFTYLFNKRPYNPTKK